MSSNWQQVSSYRLAQSLLLTILGDANDFMLTLLYLIDGLLEAMGLSTLHSMSSVMGVVQSPSIFVNTYSFLRG
jgi:hypothetical protein